MSKPNIITSTIDRYVIGWISAATTIKEARQILTWGESVVDTDTANKFEDRVMKMIADRAT